MATQTVLIDPAQLGPIVVTAQALPYKDRAGSQRIDPDTGLPMWQVGVELDAAPNVPNVPLRFVGTEELARSFTMFSAVELAGRVTMTAYGQREKFRTDAAASLPIKAETVRLVDHAGAAAVIDACIVPVFPAGLVLVRVDGTVVIGDVTYHRCQLGLPYTSKSNREAAERVTVDVASDPTAIVHRGQAVELIGAVARPRVNAEAGTASLNLSASALRPAAEVASHGRSRPSGRKAESEPVEAVAS